MSYPTGYFTNNDNHPPSHHLFLPYFQGNLHECSVSYVFFEVIFFNLPPIDQGDNIFYSIKKVSKKIKNMPIGGLQHTFQIIITDRGPVPIIDE